MDNPPRPPLGAGMDGVDPVTSHAIARRAAEWRPAWDAVDRSRGRSLKVGDVVAYAYAAWKITHIGPMVEPDEHGRDTRATLHRLHGPKHERENSHDDLVVRFRASWHGFEVYRRGRVYLCSCCGHPAPCRMQVAEEASELAAKEFDQRLSRMGPGLCYGCGEVITTRQERITFPGDHADFPGRGGPTFHARQKCAGERWAYARRASRDPETGVPLPEAGA